MILFLAASVILLGDLPATIGRGEKALLVLKDGRKFYGRILLERKNNFVFKRKGKTECIDPDFIMEKLSEEQIDRTISSRRKRLAKNDVEAHIQLALFCLEVERLKAAKELLRKAYNALLPEGGDHYSRMHENSAAKKVNTTGKSDPMPAARQFPWQSDERAALKIEVKKKIEGKEFMQQDNLKMQIEAILANHTQTKDYGIGVKDDNGVITLIGKVPSRDVKQLAEMLVKKQAGVSAVINELGIEQVDQDKEETIIPLPVPPSDIHDSNPGS